MEISILKKIKCEEGGRDMKGKIHFKKKAFCYAVVLSFLLIPVVIVEVDAGPPIKIGVVQPITGKHASYGVSITEGAKFAVNEINVAGGIKSLGGTKIELVIGDDQGEVKVCKTQLEAILSREKVSGIVGPFSSAMCQATAPLSDRNKVPFITTSAPEGSVFGREFNLKYFYSIAGTTENFGISYVGVLDWLVKKHGLKPQKIGLLYPDNTYGKAVAAAVKKELSNKGYSLAVDMTYDWRASDFSPYILKLKAANVDTLIQTGYFQDGVLSHQARYHQEYYPVVIGGIAALTDDRIWSQVGGGEMSKKALGGPVFCCNWFEPTQAYRPYQEMLARAQAKGVQFGGLKGVDSMWFSGGVQGIYCYRAAIERAASMDPEAINKALKGLRIQKGSPDLVIPLYDPALEWDEFGSPQNQSFVFVQWVDGRKVPVYPEEYAQMAPRIR